MKVKKIDTAKQKAKKLLKIEEYTHKLGGVKRKYLKSERYLVENFNTLSVNRIIKRKTVISKRAKRMRNIAKALKKLGVCVDLEKR